MRADESPFRVWLAVVAIAVAAFFMLISYNVGVDEGIRIVRCDEAIRKAMTAKDSLDVLTRRGCADAR